MKFGIESLSVNYSYYFFISMISFDHIKHINKMKIWSRGRDC